MRIAPGVDFAFTRKDRIDIQKTITQYITLGRTLIVVRAVSVKWHDMKTADFFVEELLSVVSLEKGSLVTSKLRNAQEAVATSTMLAMFRTITSATHPKLEVPQYLLEWLMRALLSCSCKAISSIEQVEKACRGFGSHVVLRTSIARSAFWIQKCDKDLDRFAQSAKTKFELIWFEEAWGRMNRKIKASKRYVESVYYRTSSTCFRFTVAQICWSERLGSGPQIRCVQL